MPNTKSSNSSKNNSRKSTKSSTSSKVDLDEDGFPSVVIRYSQPSSKKTTPKTPRPEFLEASPSSPSSPSPPSPWEMLSMPEGEYRAMMARVFRRYEEIDRENYENALLAEVHDPRYWATRMNQLEREREFFNKKRGWSAAEMACVERIDMEIEDCEVELDRIYSKIDQMEYDCD